jgi:hypothetical protein
MCVFMKTDEGTPRHPRARRAQNLVLNGHKLNNSTLADRNSTHIAITISFLPRRKHS